MKLTGNQHRLVTCAGRVGRRTGLLIALMVVVSGVAALPASAEIAVTQRNQVELGDTARDQNDESFTVRGLSGITYVGLSPDAAGAHRYLAVMDNSDKLVTIDVELLADGGIGSASIVGGHTLALNRDFEGIAYHRQRQSVLLSEEDTPQVHEFDLGSIEDSQGRQVLPVVQSLDRPGVFDHVRHNLGFESLALHPDLSQLWTANEEALSVDGPRSTASSGSVVRLLRYNLSGPTAGMATAAEQYAYLTEPLHAQAGTNFPSASGLVELLMLPDGTLLALERSVASTYFVIEIPSIQLRLYEVGFEQATDISGLSALDGETYTGVSKRLLWSDTGLGIGNLEGMALGPQLPNGNWSLIAVVDNDGGYPNRLVAFELHGLVIPEPSAGVLLLGLLALSGRGHRSLW